MWAVFLDTASFNIVHRHLSLQNARRGKFIGGLCAAPLAQIVFGVWLLSWIFGIEQISICAIISSSLFLFARFHKDSDDHGRYGSWAA